MTKFEFAIGDFPGLRPPPPPPRRKANPVTVFLGGLLAAALAALRAVPVVAATGCLTVFASFRVTAMRLAKALFWSAIVVAVLVLGGAAITSIAAGSLRPLESTPSMLLGLSVAMGAASIAIWAMSTYLADPEQHMAKQFAGKATPLQLRTATFFGFVSALLIQAALFAAVTWGIEYAWTGFSLFKDPSTANYINVFLFWLDRTFQMVDAKETFGMQLSALQADTSFWPFGVCILFFRLILIATIVRAITSAFSASE